MKNEHATQRMIAANSASSVDWMDLTDVLFAGVMVIFSIYDNSFHVNHLA
jgi:hypothetical protein